MTELKHNHQIVYFHHQNAMAVSMNLMAFGFRQFILTSKWEKLDDFKKLCDDLDSTNTPDIHLTSYFAFNQLLDSIKITICLENFMKSLLLLNGFLIHRLDKNYFEPLYKFQFERPILFKEIKEVRDWEINAKIKLENEGLKNQIKGILINTIGMKELLSKGYQDIFKIDKKIIEICNPYFKYRNNLHYYIGESFALFENDFFNFTTLVDFLNDHLVRINNELIDELKKGESYKLPRLKYCP